jgi:hypothetical protein
MIRYRLRGLAFDLACYPKHRTLVELGNWQVRSRLELPFIDFIQEHLIVSGWHQYQGRIVGQVAQCHQV